MIQQVTRDLRRAIVAIHNGEDVDAATIEELLTRGERNAASASDAERGAEHCGFRAVSMLLLIPPSLTT